MGRPLQQLLIAPPKGVGGDGRYALLIPQLVHPKSLLSAHKLSKAVSGIGPLVIDLAPDPVGQVVLLLVRILGAEAPSWV